MKRLICALIIALTAGIAMADHGHGGYRHDYPGGYHHNYGYHGGYNVYIAPPPVVVPYQRYYSVPVPYYPPPYYTYPAPIFQYGSPGVSIGIGW